LTCTALQADDKENKAANQGAAGKEYHADKAGKGPLTQEQFIQKALSSGQMEVELGRLGEQQAQNQQVKSLASTLTRDHSEANQKLQRIATAKSVSVDPQDKSKHQQHLDKIKSQSGAEFDREFVRMVAKHHKKGISQFEKAQTQFDDQELKTFITETLPKLRQHLQMAQTAARAVGVDEASLTAYIEADEDSAAGAAAGAAVGSEEKSVEPIKPDNSSQPSDTERPRSSIDSDNDSEINASVETDKDGKVFQKGDGKVLGLSTDKNDGKFLGVIPNPRADDKDKDTEVEADVDVGKDDSSVGASATVETESSKKDQ